MDNVITSEIKPIRDVILEDTTCNYTTKEIVQKRTMSDILRYPVENTIALGGVPTGNMKANDAATAHGIIKYRG